MDSILPRLARRRLQNMKPRRTSPVKGDRGGAVAANSLYTKVPLCILNSIVGGGAKRHRFSKPQSLTPMSIARMRSACNFSGRSERNGHAKKRTVFVDIRNRTGSAVEPEGIGRGCGHVCHRLR